MANFWHSYLLPQWAGSEEPARSWQGSAPPALKESPYLAQSPAPEPATQACSGAGEEQVFQELRSVWSILDRYSGIRRTMSWKCLFHSVARHRHLLPCLPPCSQPAQPCKCSPADYRKVLLGKHIPLHMLLLASNIHKYFKNFICFWGRYYLLSYILVQNPVMVLEGEFTFGFLNGKHQLKMPALFKNEYFCWKMLRN